MKNEIKQQIEKEALIFRKSEYADSIADDLVDLLSFKKGAEYGYSLAQQSVNIELVRQVQRLISWLRMEGNNDDIQMILEAEEVMNRAESLLSDSQNQQQENKEEEKWIDVNEANPTPMKSVLIAMKYGSGKVNFAITCMIQEDDGSLYWNSRDEEDITHWKELIYPNPPTGIKQ